MYDIKPLEEEWKKYKKKKRRPLVLFALSVLILLILSFTFLNYKEMILIKFYNEVNKETNNSTLKPIQLLMDKALTELEIKKQDRVDVLETESMPISSTKDSPIEMIDESFVEENINIIKKPKIKKYLKIIETSDESAYSDVAKRFKQSKNTDDSLFLAKSYYLKGNYKKANYWALQTNKINNNIEESWLIFVKSKVKLGQKGDAINILMTYIKRTNSVNANNLLIKIKEGTL